jgi:elongation factor G
VLCGSAFKNKGVQPLLDAVVDYLPSPLDVPAIKGIEPDDGGASVVAQAADDEPFAALAFKIMNDPFVGKLTFFRVYSGKLRSGVDGASTRRKDSKERIGRMLLMHANNREEIKEVYAGDIVAARRPQGHDAPATRSAIRTKPVILETMEFPEPGHRGRGRAEDQGRPGEDGHRAAASLADGGSVLPRRDRSRRPARPSSRGMGELHLDILVDRMKREFKVEANVGKPAGRLPRDHHARRSNIEYTPQEADRWFAVSTATSSSSVEPASAGKGFEFDNEIVGGCSPEGIHPGRREGRRARPSTTASLAGFPMRRRQGRRCSTAPTTTSTRRRWRSRSPARMALQGSGRRRPSRSCSSRS